MKKVTEHIVCDNCGVPIENGRYIVAVGLNVWWHKGGGAVSHTRFPDEAHFCGADCLTTMLADGRRHPLQPVAAPVKAANGKTVTIHEYLTTSEVLAITGWGSGYLKNRIARGYLTPIGKSPLFAKDELVAYKAACGTKRNTKVKPAPAPVAPSMCYEAMPDSTLLSRKKAGEFLGVNPHHLYKLKRDRKVTQVDYMGTPCFHLGSLRAYKDYIVKTQRDSIAKATATRFAKRAAKLATVPPQALPAA